MKKYKCFVIFITLILSLNTLVYGATLDKISVSGSKVTVSVSATDNESVRMVISDKEHKKVYAVRDENAENGKVEFITLMPNDAEKGEYEVIIKEDGKDLVSNNFIYAKEQDVNNLYIKLCGNITSEIFDKDSQDRIPLLFMCNGFEVYDTFTENMKNDFIQKLSSNKNDCKTSAEMGDCIKKCLGMAMLGGKYSGAVDILYDEPLEIKEKAWAEEYLTSNAPYSTISEINSACKVARVLYAINNAKISNIYNEITENASVLEIENDSKLSSYKGMTEYNKSIVNEKLLTSLSKNPVKTLIEFKSLFNDCVNVESKKTERTSSGSSSSGGRSEGTKTVPQAVINETANEKTEEIEFSDLNNVSWAKEMIYELAKRNIINGAGDGKFYPDKAVSREEFVKMLVLANNITLTSEIGNFSDVDANKWFAPYVYTAVQKGFVNGISENEFGTGLSITRQDMAVMLVRALGNSITLKRDENNFSDNNEISDYAKDSINRLYRAEIIDGNEQNCFMPKKTLTRAEAAKVIYCAFIK